MSNNDISNILALGAPSRNNLQNNRITQAEKDSLRQLAATHQVRYNPNLNSATTARTFVSKKISDAQKIKNPTQRAAALARWQNMIDEYKDLDGKPETPDNYIIRNKNDVNDIYSIDGMRLTGRTGAIVQRGVFDQFPSVAQRRDNKEFIGKIYKKYLRKYLKPEDRAKHPFDAQMAASIDAKLTADESLFSRIATAVRAVLASWGVTVKSGDGSTKLTTPHYGNITSKVASDYYRLYMIPQLAAQSVWASHIPQGYSFADDPNGLLQNKKFRDSMLAVWKAKGSTIQPNYQLIAGSLQKHGTELQGDNLMLRVNGINGANAQVDIMDAAAQEQDYRKASMAAIRQSKPTRSQIWNEYSGRSGGLRNYSARSNLQQTQALPMPQPTITPVPMNTLQRAPQVPTAVLDSEGDVVMDES
ncbi:hypothetical protein FACS189472_15370 [Alphaproteobacteria bacterium]|nr:hypothetical protein FACS189472_15370 [Alphaproteobacteria bacterium]